MCTGTVLVVRRRAIGPLGYHDQGDAQREPLLRYRWRGGARVDRFDVFGAGLHDVRAADDVCQSFSVDRQVADEARTNVGVEGYEHFGLLAQVGEPPSNGGWPLVPVRGPGTPCGQL